MPINKNIAKNIGQKVRIRACGLLWRGDSLLMVNHHGLYGFDFWAPPGGGIDFGVTIKETLTNEFWEECGITIKVGSFLFGYEFINAPLHAIELFYQAKFSGGILRTGTDPELAPHNQIITKVQYMALSSIVDLPPKNVHPLFKKIKTREEIGNLYGFYPLT